MAIFRFYKMAPVRHFGFFYARVWTRREDYFTILIVLQNLVEIEAASSFDNMQVYFILRVWLENAYSRPRWRVWDLTP